MKAQKILKASFCIVLVCLMAAVFSACGAKQVSVTVNDAGTKTVVTADVGTVIGALLESAGITLGEKDVTEPNADEKIEETTTEITVKRYAKVTVVKGDEKKEVELVGGTVEEAIKQAGFTLAEGDAADAELTAYLKDGMTINITSALKVTLTIDGSTKEYTTSAVDVKGFLDEQGVQLGADDEVSEKTDAKLTDGMKITVKRVEYKEEKKTESFDYSTEEKYSDSMNSGESEVTQKGEKGEKEVVYKVKYVDGKEDSREKKSEKVTKEAVTEIITYGTKTESQSSNSGNGGGNSGGNGGSGGRTVISKTPVYDCDGSGHGYYEIVYSDGTTEYVEF